MKIVTQRNGNVQVDFDGWDQITSLVVANQEDHLQVTEEYEGKPNLIYLRMFTDVLNDFILDGEVDIDAVQKMFSKFSDLHIYLNGEKVQ